jgi:hypothetical protein
MLSARRQYPFDLTGGQTPLGRDMLDGLRARAWYPLPRPGPFG